jgi:hypothetical protein
LLQSKEDVGWRKIPISLIDWVLSAIATLISSDDLHRGDSGRRVEHKTVLNLN